MTFEGWLFDLYPARGGMTLWLIDAEGRRVRLVAPYRPSFYIGGSSRTLRHVRDALRRSRAPVSLSPVERQDIWTGRAIPVLRVSANVKSFGSVVRQVSRLDGVEIYNCDIPLDQLYLYETGLFPLTLCKAEHSKAGSITSIRASDSPWSIDYPLPPLVVLKLSVDGNKANPNYGGGRCGLKVEIDGTEYLLEDAELLETLEGMLTKFDPDIILTEWGDSFIIPRLVDMARKQSSSLSLNRDHERAIVTRRGASYFSYGRIIYRAPARTLFGRWHIDLKNSFFTSETGLEGLFEIARLTKIPVQRLARTSPGTGISSMQLALAVKNEILIPWRKRRPEDFKSAAELLASDKGGLVYLPKPGVYDNVVEIDFASMYPAIMVRHNISPETINCDCCQGARVPEIGHRICQKRRGLVPRVLEPILNKRSIYKKLSRRGEDAELRKVYARRQTALKWLLVTCFGYLGYRNARYGRIEAHEAVTAFGREKLLQAKEMAEHRGFEVLHAIVDSLWIRKENMTQSDQEGLLREISESTGVPMAVEGTYRWIAFVPSRTAPNLAVANRYFGLFDSGGMKIRGLEVRRSDMPPIVKKMQTEMLQVLSTALNAEEFRQKATEILEILKKYLARLRHGHVLPEELVISQRLSKDPSAYKTNTAMAAASRILLASGVKPSPGEKVGLIIVDSKATDQATKAIPYTAATESSDTYDTDKYSEFLIRATESVLLRRIGDMTLLEIERSSVSDS